MPTNRLTLIPAEALKAIEAVAGPVLDIEMLSAGYNSEIAARLHFTDGTVFVKGLSQDHPRVWTQQREADINPHTDGLAPALRWHIQKAGWNLLGFEDLDGRHADYSPGSPDLELVLQALWRLAALGAPSSVDLKSMRMREHVEDPEEAGLFAGSHLLHTDWNPHNVLIVDGMARLVDWAWASRGAAWIDPALWVIWLIASGHSVNSAESLAGRHPAWDSTPVRSIDAFAQAQRRLWETIASADEPDEWTHKLHAAARAWAEQRQ